MLQKLKLLYPALDEEILLLLLDNAEAYACAYCHLDTLPSSMEPIAIRMVQEDVSRLYAEGFNSESTAGNSVSYKDDYSSIITKMLNRYKRVRAVV